MIDMELKAVITGIYGLGYITRAEEGWGLVVRSSPVMIDGSKRWIWCGYRR